MTVVLMELSEPDPSQDSNIIGCTTKTRSSKMLNQTQISGECTSSSWFTQSKSQRDVENGLKNTDQPDAQQNHTKMWTQLYTKHTYTKNTHWSNHSSTVHKTEAT